MRASPWLSVAGFASKGPSVFSVLGFGTFRGFEGILLSARPKKDRLRRAALGFHRYLFIGPYPVTIVASILFSISRIYPQYIL